MRPCFAITLTLKVQRTSMSFKSWFGALEDTGGSWLGFGILILIWIWSLVFDTNMFKKLALCLDFEGAKNMGVLWVLICSFGGHWRFLTRVWHLDFDLDGLRNLAWIFLEVFISFRLVEAEKIAQRVSVYTFLAGAGAGCWAGLGVQNRGQAQLGSALLSFDNMIFVFGI